MQQAPTLTLHHEGGEDFEPRRVIMHKSHTRGVLRRGCTAALGLLLLAGSRQVAQAQAWAQPPRVHYRWSQEAVPGEIGTEQVRHGIVPQGYFQPVRILGPEGLEVGVRSGAGSEVTLRAPADFALRVGAVYRLRLGGIPEAVGAQLFPSVELIDRLHPPQGVEGRHPIPIHFTQEDLELALRGRLVTKVVYLEQQDFAVPDAREKGETPIYDATPQQDALEAADVFGRPVAIVRLGQWAPLDADWSDDPLGPPAEVVFPIGGPGAATAGGAGQAVGGRQNALGRQRRVGVGARSAVARDREPRRTAVQVPPSAPHGVEQGKRLASPGRSAVGQQWTQRATGTNRLTSRSKSVNTGRHAWKRSEDASGQPGSWRPRRASRDTSREGT